MTSRRSTRDRVPARPGALLCAALLVLLPACSAYQSPDTAMAPAGLAPLRVNTPTPDPRVGLAPGLFDAGEAIWNLRLDLGHAAHPRYSSASTNSDLAFTGDYVIQGNYDGIQIWDISDAHQPAVGGHLPCAPPRRATSPSTATCSSSRARDSEGGSTAAIRAWWRR